MRQMQPEGGHPAIAPAPNPIGRMLHSICGVHLRITAGRAKFKFGRNRTRPHRELIAARLLQPGRESDTRARQYLLGQLGLE